MPRFIYTPEFKAVFKKGATEKRFPLSKKFVADLVEEMVLGGEEFSEREMIPNRFAQYDDYRMRMAAAGLNGLSSSQAEELARDPAFKVRLRLSMNDDALSQLSSTALIDLGRTDPEIASNVLTFMDHRPEGEVKKIAAVLKRTFSQCEDIAEAAQNACELHVLDDDEAKEWVLQQRMPAVDPFEKEWLKEGISGEDWLVYLSAGKDCYRIISDEMYRLVFELSDNKDFQSFAPDLLRPCRSALAKAVEDNVDTLEVVRILIRSENCESRLGALSKKSARMLTNDEIKETLEDDPSLIAAVHRECSYSNKRFCLRLCRLYAEFPDRALQEELEESRRIAEDKDNDGGISPMAIFGNVDSGSDLEDDSAEDDDDLIEVDNTESDWDWNDGEEEEDDDWEEEGEVDEEDEEDEDEEDEEDEEDGKDGEARSPGAEERPRSTVLRLDAGL